MMILPLPSGLFYCHMKLLRPEVIRQDTLAQQRRASRGGKNASWMLNVFILMSRISFLSSRL